MSDRYEYYVYGINFEINPFWEQAAAGRSYLLTQVGFPSFVLEYVYLKYPHGRSKVIPNTRVLMMCLLAMPSMHSTPVFWLVLVVFEIFDPHPLGNKGGGGGFARPPIHDPRRSLGGSGGGSQTSHLPRIGLPILLRKILLGPSNSPYECGMSCLQRVISDPLVQVLVVLVVSGQCRQVWPTHGYGRGAGHNKRQEVVWGESVLTLSADRHRLSMYRKGVCRSLSSLSESLSFEWDRWIGPDSPNARLLWRSLLPSLVAKSIWYGSNQDDVTTDFRSLIWGLAIRGYPARWWTPISWRLYDRYVLSRFFPRYMVMQWFRQGREAKP